MKTEKIELTISVTGKIPRRSYENYAPMFVVKEVLDVQDGPFTDFDRLARQQELYNQCANLFNEVREGVTLEEVQAQFKNLDFVLNEKTGKRYPRTTDIIYWDTDFYISPEMLSQYGSRGSAVHSMFANWRATKKWDKSVINRRDKIVLQKGTERFWDTLDELNFLGFWEAHGKDIEFTDGEFRAFNDEHFYTGQPDAIGKYKGVPSIFDLKCRGIKDEDFEQMASYLHLDDPRLKDIKQMVGIPLNAKNKGGFGKPSVSTDIEKYWNIFLRDRKDFKDKFNV